MEWAQLLVQKFPESAHKQNDENFSISEMSFNNLGPTVLLFLAFFFSDHTPQPPQI